MDEPYGQGGNWWCNKYSLPSIKGHSLEGGKRLGKCNIGRVRHALI